MSEITSFAGLEHLRLKLTKSPELAMKVAAKAAPALSSLAAKAFGSHTSPYGDPWGTGSTGEPLDLEVSGALKEKAIRYEAHGTKVRATVGAVRWARFQLKHGILPKKGKLPTDWDREVKRIADAELSAYFGRA